MSNLATPPRLPFFDREPRDYRPDTPPDLSGVDTVSLDAETDGLEWWRGARPVGWAVKRRGDVARYLPFGHRAGGNLDEKVVREWARRELRGKRVVNFNMKFDLLMMRAWGVDLEAQGCTFHDPGHSAALLDDHRQRFNLHELAEDELGSGKLDPGVPKDQIHTAPAWQVAPYACRDVDLVERLQGVYTPRLASEGLLRVATLEDQVIPATAEMEWNGVPYDVAKLERWIERIGVLEQDYLWTLYRTFGFTVDPSDKASLKRLWSKLGIVPTKRYGKKGAYDSFAGEIVEDATAAHPSLEALQKVVKLRAIRSRFLRPIQENSHQGIYRPSYHQLRSVSDDGTSRGTVSGRFSAAVIHQIMGRNKYETKYGDFKGSAPDAPIEQFYVRELFYEPDGYWFNVDAKQIQYRIMVHCSQSPRLLHMYVEDPRTNFHKRVGAWVHEVRPDYTETQIKIANFLTIFGGGVAATASFFKCSMDEAQEFRDVYFGQFPEARETIDRVKAVAERRGWVQSPLGRRSRFPYGTWTDKGGNARSGRQRTHKALNAVCQMTEADMLKTNMVKLHEQRHALGYTPRICLHDELDGRLADKATIPAMLAIVNTQWVPISVVTRWEGGCPDGEQTWSNAK